MQDVFQTKIRVTDGETIEFFNNTLDGVVKDVLFELTAADKIYLDAVFGITKEQIEDKIHDGYGEHSTHVIISFERTKFISETVYISIPHYIVVETMMRIVGD
uniref:Uncharacterized protein n=1 Tax=viral metagenome TaxID=1070528 RepID=A0A6C0AHP5_9ZZZZ